MKKEITTLFLTLAAAFGFAQQVPQATVSANILEIEPARPAIEMKVSSPQKSFWFLKMGVSDTQVPKNTEQMVPGIGVGYRIADGSLAYELSISGNRRDFRTDAGRELTYQYTLPKANAFYHFANIGDNSVYVGGGLAWTGVKTEDATFHGLGSNGALGIELGRKALLHSFIQLDVSQPVVAAYQKGALPGPYAELSIGAGF